MKPVGILGGMGPDATVLLMQKVLRAVPAKDDADHIPLIVHQNPAVPSRIAALIDGTGADPAPVLAQMARDLRAAGATALAMPCNTAHHYAAAIRDATDLPFLNMLDLTAQHLARVGASRIGMLASPAVRMTGVFDAAFAGTGLMQVYPMDDTPVLDLIRAVKAGQVLDADALRAPALALLDQGADHILIACTELSLYTDSLGDDLAWSDSLDCLTREIVATARACGG
jgi:aspartate racemase